MSKFKVGDRVIGYSENNDDYTFANLTGGDAVKNNNIATITEINSKKIVHVLYDKPMLFFNGRYYEHELRHADKDFDSLLLDNEIVNEQSIYQTNIDNAWAEDLHKASTDATHTYHSLACALTRAYGQAAIGKGKQRHANNLPFDKQPMQTHTDALGSVDGLCYQVMKKCRESNDMNDDAAIAELCGVINYAAGMIIWRQRNPKK